MDYYIREWRVREVEENEKSEREWRKRKRKKPAASSTAIGDIASDIGGAAVNTLDLLGLFRLLELLLVITTVIERAGDGLPWTSISCGNEADRAYVDYQGPWGYPC